MYSVSPSCMHDMPIRRGGRRTKKPLIPVDHLPARDFQAMRVERWEMYSIQQLGPKQENCAHGSHMARPWAHGISGISFTGARYRSLTHCLVLLALHLPRAISSLDMEKRSACLKEVWDQSWDCASSRPGPELYYSVLINNTKSSPAPSIYSLRNKYASSNRDSLESIVCAHVIR